MYMYMVTVADSSGMNILPYLKLLPRNVYVDLMLKVR